MKVNTKAHNGFTLIEVMVALSIFALAAVASLQAASGHLSSITTLQDKMYAQYVASNRMAESRLEQRWPVRDNHSGTMAMGGQTWRWQQQVTETVTPNVVAIRVTVGRSEEEGEATRLMSYYRRPQEAATTELTQ